MPCGSVFGRSGVLCRKIARRCLHREERAISCRKNRSRASGMPCGSVFGCIGVSCRKFARRCLHKEAFAISCREDRSRASDDPFCISLLKFRRIARRCLQVKHLAISYRMTPTDAPTCSLDVCSASPSSLSTCVPIAGGRVQEEEHTICTCVCI